MLWSGAASWCSAHSANTSDERSVRIASPPSTRSLVCARCAAPALPSCGTYVGQEFLVSKGGRCVLPDGEIMAGGIWAPRHPGQPVTYVVNWTTGGDDSQVRGELPPAAGLAEAACDGVSVSAP